MCLWPIWRNRSNRCQVVQCVIVGSNWGLDQVVSFFLRGLDEDVLKYFKTFHLTLLYECLSIST